MARFRSKEISIYYAGSKLYDGYDETQSLAELPSISRQYSTSAEQIVDAEAPIIRAYGNAAGGMSVSVLLDFQNEYTAFRHQMAWTNFADSHQTGQLYIDYGNREEHGWEAGLESFEVETVYVPGAVRLNLRFSFILGAKIAQ